MIPRIVLVILLYFLYRSVKAWLRSVFEGDHQVTRKKPGKGAPQIEGDMIQDPYCKVYFAREEGVVLQEGGETFVFCSEDCRDAFLIARKKS